MHGKHAEKTCIKCGATRLSNKFTLGTTECKTCPKKGPSSKRSEKAGSKKSASLQNEEVKKGQPLQRNLSLMATTYEN
jgi:hypothetical protein